MNVSHSKTAIVVGAGITGVASALHLQRDRWDVTLIDRISPGDAGQTSYGNAGLLARCAVVPVSVPGLWKTAPKMLLNKRQPLFMRWSYFPRLLPWLIPFLKNGRADRMNAIAEALSHLTFDSVDQHIQLAQGTDALRHIETGPYSYIYTSRDSRAKDAPYHQIRADFGLPSVERDRAYLAEKDPHLAPAFECASEFSDHGWIKNPGAYVSALFEGFERAGGQFVSGEVQKIDTSSQRSSISIGSKVYDADKIVVCAGVWSRKLVETLGLKIPMESERGYHLMLHGTNFKPPHPYMIAAGKFAITPMSEGIRVAGVVELGGIDAPPSKEPWEMLRHYLSHVYPDLQYEREETWMGHRPSTIDSLPVVGAIPKSKNIILAFGGQHIGLTMGPKVGRMVADIAGERPSNVDLSPYRVDRFA